MNIGQIIHAIRVGNSVENDTPYHWADAAVVVSIIGLSFAQDHGWLAGITEGDMSILVLAVLSLVAKILSTKVGILPATKSQPAPRLHDHALPPHADGGGSSQSQPGFPTGPFFDVS